MKRRKLTKKKCIMTAFFAGVVLAGIFGFGRFTAKAYGVLTGIETKVAEKVTAKEKYHILEVIPDGSMGEIGYLVKDYEPVPLQNRMDTYLLGAKVTNTKANRAAYVDSLDGILTGLYSTDGTTPLSFVGNYEESYFPDETAKQNLGLVTFSSGNYEDTILTGQFVKNTKGEGTYDENIISFSYSGTGGYYVEFEGTAPPAEGDAHYGDSLYSQPYEYKAGGYYQLVTNPKVNMKYAYISSFSYYGSEVTSARYAANIDSQYPYKYVGTDGYYDFVEGTVTTDPASTEASVNASFQMQIGQVYYKGGYTNNEWFKNKIFAADILEKAKDMDIDVTTVTESQLKDTDLSSIDFVYICGDTTGSGKEYQVNGANWTKVQELYQMVNSKSVPCLVDSSILNHLAQNTVASDVDKLALLLMAKPVLSGAEPDWNTILAGLDTKQFDGIHTNYVTGCVYFMDTTDKTSARQPLFADLDTNLDTLYGADTLSNHFSEISSAISGENAVRSGDDLLDTNISKRTAIQYIINYQNKREIVKKESITILDIEPAWGKAYTTTDDSQVLTAAKVRSDWGIDASAINIVHMTTAEFIGKIDDLNTDYDVIYFGLGYASDYMHRDTAGKVIYNDANMGNLVYTHTGDYVYGKIGIAGILDTDFIKNSRSNYLYGSNAALNDANDAFGYRVSATTNADGIIHLRQIVQSISNFPVSTSAKETVSVGNVGLYRYSGNDITKSKLSDLKEYVGAKYPVIFADGFFSGGVVNSTLIDNSSYLYDFVNTVKSEDNVYKYSELAASTTFANYLNLAKLTVQFYSPEKTNITDEPILKSDYTNIVSQGDLLTSNNNYGNAIVEIDKTNAAVLDSYTLRMRFEVSSSVDASSSTRYVFHYYMDLNADGKYTVTDTYSEEMSDILIYDESGKEVTKNSVGEYELNSGQKYTLEKMIPATYRGVLPWKLEVCQTENEAVRTSDISYTIISPETAETAQTVNVLQVLSDGMNGKYPNTFNMKTNNTFQNLLKQVKSSVGLDFQVNTVTANQFDTYFSNGHKVSNTAAQACLDQFYNKGNCDGYDMLIIGFGDCYNSLNSADAMDAIQKYATTGRSVLFTHDTTSFVNVSSSANWKSLAKSSNTGTGVTTTTSSDDWWGYQFNTVLRNLVGMDRYGVTSAVKTYSNDLTDAQKLQYFRSALLKEGQILDLSEQKDTSGKLTNIQAVINAGGFCTSTWNGSGLGTSAVSLGTDKDIAYVAGSAKTQSYGETQGYTYSMLDSHLADYSGSTKSNQKFLQYTPNRESTVASQVNDGQITHYPYEIGTKLNVASTHYQYYQLDMDLDRDQDGNNDIVVWYCLDSSSSTVSNYTVSPNDVRNNYYIYSMGNIMYTGVGHSAVGSSLNELKLFANTLVAAYKATPQKPNISIISSSDRTSAKKSYTYINMEQSINSKNQQSGQALDSDISFYYTVNDSNLATSKKDIRAKYYLVSSDGATVSQLGVATDSTQAYISTKDTNEQYAVTEANGEVSGLTSGHVYTADLHNVTTDTGTLKTMLDSGKFKIQVQIESTFTYYGAESSAKTSADMMTVMKTNLIDLQ